MKLHKIHEKNFNYYIFLLEDIQNNILIDDSDTSLSIFNLDLKLLTRITDIPFFGMYSVYKNCQNNKILFTSSDDYTLLYVDLVTTQSKIVDASFVNDLFSRLYFWQDDLLILVTRSKKFYQYDYNKNTLNILLESFIQATYPNFYNFYQVYSIYRNKLSINAYTQSFIQFDESSPTIEFHDFKNNFIAYTKKPLESQYFTDILYCNGVFVFVYDDMLILYYDNKHIKLERNSVSYRFFKVRFFKDQDNLFLVILLERYPPPPYTILQIYKVTY